MTPADPSPAEEVTQVDPLDPLDPIGPTDAEVRRFARLRQLFDDVSNLEAAPRRELLAAIAESEAELYEPLLDLLALSERTVSPLDEAGWQEHPPWTERVGAYRVLREIGRGGSSIVYLAEQEGEGFTRQVALKRLVSTETASVLADRVGAEQRILAALEHPGIARLYDAGKSAEGVPYLAMEYVEGVDIVSYREANDLALRATLELFLQVAEALDYAHQRYVVHRDIKPRNILVAADGRARLLDFGIARILDPETDEATRTHLRAMTPAYASPEQMRGDRVGAASDQYSLGVVLYELLCGRRPFESRDRSWAEIERSVQEDEPTAPSAVIAGATGGSASAGDRGANRDDTATTRPAGWRRSIAGDLDTIVLKSLRKAPASRYRSVRELAEDLQNFLDGRPIAARRGNLAYRVSKFARRHRAPLAASTAAAAAVIFAFPKAANEPFSPWLDQAPRRGEARQAYLKGVAHLRQYDGAAAARSFTTVVEREPENPLALAALAQAHRLEGRDIQASDEAERAARLGEKLPPDSRLWLEGLAAHENGRGSAAVDTLRTLWTVHPGDLELGLQLADGLRQAGRGAEALEVVAALRRLPGELARDIRIDFAEFESLDDAGRFKDAGVLVDRLLAEPRFASPSIFRLDALLFSGNVKASVGDQDGARRRLEEIRPVAATFGGDYQKARAQYLHCRVALHDADHVGVERHGAAALEIYRRLGNLHGTAQSLNAIGVSRRRRGELESARTAIEEALAIHRRRGDRSSEGRMLNNLANIHRDLGDLEEAEQAFRASVDVRRGSGEERGVGLTMANLGMVLLDRGRLADAERILVESETLLRRSGTGRELSRLVEEKARLAEYRSSPGEIERAFAEAIQARVDVGEADSRLSLEARREAVRCRLDMRRADPTIFEAAHRTLHALGDADAPQVLTWWTECLVARGEHVAAKRLLDRAESELAASEQPAGRVRVGLARARWEISTGRFAAASATVELALAESRRHGFGPETLDAAFVEVQLARARGEPSTRVRTLAEALEGRAREEGFLNLAASAARLRAAV